MCMRHGHTYSRYILYVGFALGVYVHRVRLCLIWQTHDMEMERRNSYHSCPGFGLVEGAGEVGDPV